MDLSDYNKLTVAGALTITKDNSLQTTTTTTTDTQIGVTTPGTTTPTTFTATKNVYDTNTGQLITQQTSSVTIDQIDGQIAFYQEKIDSLNAAKTYMQSL